MSLPSISILMLLLSVLVCTITTTLLSDSTGAISIARDPVKHELTKHIGVDTSFVCASVQDQVIALQYVPLELQLADFFMKAQTRAHHSFFLSSSMLLIHHEFEGEERGC
jgi:hypothetical protein